MKKLETDPRLLKLENFPFQTEVTARYNDMDILKHLNNVAQAAMIEDARYRFIQMHANQGLKPEDRFLLMQVSCLYTYPAQGYYPDPVTGAISVMDLGNTSTLFGCSLFQNGTCICTNEIVLVTVSPGDNRPMPIPTVVRKNLEKFRLDGNESR